MNEERPRRSHSVIGLNRSLHLYNNGVQRMKIRDLKAQRCRNKRKATEMTEDHTFHPKINRNSSMIAETMGRSSTKKDKSVFYLNGSGEKMIDPLMNMNKFRQNKSVYQRLVEKAELREVKLKKKAKRHINKEISQHSFKPKTNSVSNRIDMQARLEYEIFEPRFEQLHNLHKAHVKKKQLLKEKIDNKFSFKPKVNKNFKKFKSHKFNPEFDFLTRMELDAQERAEKDIIIKNSRTQSRQERSKSPFERQALRTMTNISTKKLYNDAFLINEKKKRSRIRQKS
jgi:ribonuclease BN (tRNA processing enzyme)